MSASTDQLLLIVFSLLKSVPVTLKNTGEYVLKCPKFKCRHAVTQEGKASLGAGRVRRGKGYKTR